VIVGIDAEVNGNVFYLLNAARVSPSLDLKQHDQIWISLSFLHPDRLVHFCDEIPSDIYVFLSAATENEIVLSQAIEIENACHP